MRLAYELERLTQFDRIGLPLRPTYVCLHHVCVCVPEQVLSSFRLTLLVQTRRTVWRFEPSSPLPFGFTPIGKPPRFYGRRSDGSTAERIEWSWQQI